MLCTQPFVRDPYGKVFKLFDPTQAYKGIPFPCGHCLACRINRRRKWTLRLCLEAYAYPADHIRYITLTYNDRYLPVSSVYGPVLWKEDIVHYIKSLRYYVPNLRYFIGGEYGEEANRPHYHALLFGIPPVFDPYVTRLWRCSSSGRVDFNIKEKDDLSMRGFVHIDKETPHVEALQYVAGYVSKKVGNPKRKPREFMEFAIQSRKPAIGTPVLEQLKAFVESYRNYVGNITTTLKINGRVLPFDRTLCKALYKYFYTDIDLNEEAFIWSMAKKFFEASQPLPFKYGRLADNLIEESAQRNIQIKKRHELFSRGVL